MPTQKQRREAARRHLERQLAARQQRAARRRQVTLIASIVGTLVVIAAVIVIVANTGTSSPKAGGRSTPPAVTSTPTGTTAPSSACPTGDSPVPVAKGSGKAVSFDGVTVKGGTNLAKPASVGSKATKAPTKLLVKDLVVGKGAAATPTSTVSVKYTGVLYCDGTEFDGPAEHGDKAISFSLTGVVPGFTQGIGGTTGVPPMKVGGRRIIIMPSSLGYGPQANGKIPANAPLVFVVDLQKVTKG